LLRYDFSFVLLHISALFIFALVVFILRIKKKSQLHYVFSLNILLVFIWSAGHILEVYTTIEKGYTVMAYVYIYYFGLCFLPISLLYTGLVFVNTRLKFSYRDVLLFIFPVVDYILVVTNDSHKLFFVKYSIFNDVAQYGPFFIVHTIISYGYIIVGLYLLLKFSIKNSGFFSRQSLLIIAGISVPFLVNVLVTFSIVRLPVYYTPITFAFAILCFAMAIFKFQFLNIVPIALQRIVDLISDSYVIINRDWEIIDFNRTFIDTFKTVLRAVRKENFLNAVKDNKDLKADAQKLFEANKKAVEEHVTVKYEDHFTGKDFDRYFSVEITPIFSGKNYLGTIILLKDITQSKKDLDTIQRNNAILMEQERLASLGQLIGGIAHNLKTPIMSISGGLEAVSGLASEYHESIGDPSVTDHDHIEIACEIKEWIDKIRPFCGYMSDIITAVKDQAVHLSDSTHSRFTLGELLKRVDILMMHELKRYHCKININSNVDMLTEFKGEVNSLVQVFDNIIVNAIHSYGDKSGDIDLDIEKRSSDIVFSFKDYGSGISKDIQKKIFREMMTTKGKFGTGLGLYMSYSTIRGRFDGDIWFESELNKGSTFYISIPYFSPVQS